MSYISEMTLIGGLFMVSIGTYLGGVWANESWGGTGVGTLRKPGHWLPFWCMPSFCICD